MIVVADKGAKFLALVGAQNCNVVARAIKLLKVGELTQVERGYANIWTIESRKLRFLLGAQGVELLSRCAAQAVQIGAKLFSPIIV